MKWVLLALIAGVVGLARRGSTTGTTGGDWWPPVPRAPGGGAKG